MIPACSQQDVVVKMPCRNVNDVDVQLLLEASQVRPGVQMANSVLPSDVTTTMVRVCNTSPHKLKKKTC